MSNLGGSASKSSVWWVRRDFRLHDNPALRAAIDAGEQVLPLFVLDPALLATAGPTRTAWLHASIAALDADLRDGGGPGLSVRQGRPEVVVPATAVAVGAGTVHVSADFGPYGRRRDQRVAPACAAQGVELTASGSPYAVAPGTLKNGSGTAFKVFTPFHRVWQAHGVHDPAPAVRASTVDWVAAPERISLADELGATGLELAAEAGEQAALRHWHDYLAADDAGVSDYDQNHDVPGVDGTSRLSIALRWGQIHPRTVLHDLAGRTSTGAAALARQIAWRDFFADALLQQPSAVRDPIRPEFAKMPSEDPGSSPAAERALTAWQQGRTGFPMVDAGMRQLLAEGWMHNRVRMLVASFLVKDLHIGWWHGADWFMARLRDGDIAQNQLNWQWVAGCGLDAAPYFRIFNPVGQGEKFDADGRYVRRWVPELADVDRAYVQTPWDDPAGLPAGYPARIVDHAAERKEALDRYALVKA
jgi:deoxyribodipyrimidine photo-lyase